MVLLHCHFLTEGLIGELRVNEEVTLFFSYHLRYMPPRVTGALKIR